jgi:hypothetical protein
MRRRWWRGVVALGVAAAVSAGCSTLHGAGSTSCQSRVADKISADHPPSRGSSFDSSTIERRRVNQNTLAISGRGKVKTAKGAYRGFTYSCLYNERSGKLSKVQYRIE